MEHNTIDEMIEICQALKDGKEIELYGECSREWRIALLPPNFRDFRYRIKPEEPKSSRRLTNRELSRWLAQGNGEVLGSNKFADTAWNYPTECSNVEVREWCEIRKWDDTEWHEPTKEYCFREEEK